MVSSTNAGILLLSALFSSAASARSRGQWMNTRKQAERRAQEGYHDSQDFAIEYEGEQPNRENYFQEIYMLQSAPKQIEFGHVCENPDEWEQRYERKDFDENRHQGKTFPPRSYHHLPEYDSYDFGYRRGNDFHVKERFEKAAPIRGHFRIKVRWADKKGGHGEHYWDYNHSGRSDNNQEDREATSIVSETESPSRQHRKRQLLPEAEAKPSLHGEAQEFLRSFREEIGGVFHLESQNKNLFSERKSSLPRFHNGFPFVVEAAKRKA